jgi:hypothetical protein
MGDSDSIDQGVVQACGLEMIGQYDQEYVSADVFLAQDAPRNCGDLEQPTEVTRNTAQHRVVAFPTDDPLEILLVFDPHQQDLKGPSLIEHSPNTIDHHGQGRQFGDGIEQTRSVLENSRLQLDRIRDGEAVG